MLSHLLVAALTAPGPEPVLSSPAAVGRAFVQSLVADDLAMLRSLGGTVADLSVPVDYLEKYDCIVLARHEVRVTAATQDAATLSLFIDGTAITNGAVRLPVRLPAKWTLDLVAAGDEWRIRSATNDEWLLAKELIAANDGERACLLDSRRDLDLLTLIRNLAYITASYEYVADDHGAMAFAGRLAASVEDPPSSLYVLRMNALLEVFRGNGARAIEMANECVRAARQLGDPEEMATALFGLGTTSWLGGRIDEGMRHLLASASFVDSRADPRASLQALYMVALLELQQGRPRESFATAERLAERSIRWRWAEGEAVATLHKGAVLWSLGDSAGSRHYCLQAADLAQRSNNSNIAAYALFNGARQEEPSEEDVRLMRRAISLLSGESSSTLASMYAALAHGLLALGRMDEAEEAIRKGAGTSFVWPSLMQARAEFRLRQGRFAEALEDAREAVRLSEIPGGNEVRFPTWEPQTLAGQALLGLQREPEAIEAFETAIALIEERRAETTIDPASRSLFFEDKVEPYQRLIDIHAGRRRFREALLVGERMRGRTLQEVLAQGRVDVSRSMSAEEKGQEEALEKEVVESNRSLLAAIRRGAGVENLRARLSQARMALSRYRTELYLKHPDVRVRRGDDRIQALDQIDGALPGDDAAVLVYSVHRERSHVFVLTRRGHTVSVDGGTLPVGRKELNRRISAFTDALERRDLGYAAEARALYDLLVKPVEGFLSDRRVICIVPDGPLWHLPFQALRTSAGHYLIERAAVFFAPSLSALRTGAARNARSDAAKLLAFGNATFAAPRPALYRGGDLDALPDAEREVRRIAALYGPSSRVFVRGAARESAAKELAGSYQILHFATHAVIDDASPLYSSLVLAGSDAEDGLLEAREILDLRLGGEVAVLSACETAGGPVRAGEGLVGISWALMAAGCPTTVVSQWKVASSSTSSLMIEFHRQLIRLRGSPASSAQALRRAQLALLGGRYRHPFYWSAFVVVANGW